MPNLVMCPGWCTSEALLRSQQVATFDPTHETPVTSVTNGYNRERVQNITPDLAFRVWLLPPFDRTPTTLAERPSFPAGRTTRVSSVCR